MSESHQSDRAKRFDALYLDSIDPWSFRTSPYERDKYAATLAALPRARYRRALEIGCSIGELAHQLRGQCNSVLGLDVSQRAIEEARRVHADDGNLHFAVAEVPGNWPAGTCDLIVLSEMLYFLTPVEIRTLAGRVGLALEAGGHCVTVCWLGDTDSEHDMSGAEASACFASALMDDGAGGIARDDERSFSLPSYRLDVFGKL